MKKLYLLTSRQSFPFTSGHNSDTSSFITQVDKHWHRGFCQLSGFQILNTLKYRSISVDPTCNLVLDFICSNIQTSPILYCLFTALSQITDIKYLFHLTPGAKLKVAMGFQLSSQRKVGTLPMCLLTSDTSLQKRRISPLKRPLSL